MYMICTKCNYFNKSILTIYFKIHTVRGRNAIEPGLKLIKTYLELRIEKVINGFRKLIKKI